MYQYSLRGKLSESYLFIISNIQHIILKVLLRPVNQRKVSYVKHIPDISCFYRYYF